MKAPRSLLLALALVAAASVGNWLVSNSQHANARHTAVGISSTGDISEGALAEQLALEQFQVTRDVQATVAAIEAANAKVNDALAFERARAGTNQERQLIGIQTAIQAQWLAGSLGLIRQQTQRGAILDLNPERRLLGLLTRANEHLSDLQNSASASAQDHAKALSFWLMLGALALIGAVIGTALLRDRTWRREIEFDELLSSSRDEQEAYSLLKRHLERALRGVRATILGRNNSANRLELRAPTDLGQAFSEQLNSASPDSCLAIRLARPHSRRPGEDGLLSCEICGAVKDPTLCAPLIVGGKVLGAVLAARRRRFSQNLGERLAEVLLLAAPAIANQRNLALFEQRASTDPLTGLPNRRSADDALKRAVALAGRTGTPLAVLMLDIDHFKRVNDTFGHDKGDQVLAAVADVITGSLRESDYGCRYGGEEFLVLLPDTDTEGATALADKLRLSVASLRPPAGVSGVTVSLGIGIMPDDAIEPDRLVRVADRAMYMAKQLGRNRVQAATPAPDRDRPVAGRELVAGAGLPRASDPRSG